MPKKTASRLKRCQNVHFCRKDTFTGFSSHAAYRTLTYRSRKAKTNSRRVQGMLCLAE
jgi:hypothetical protein